MSLQATHTKILLLRRLGKGLFSTFCGTDDVSNTIHHAGSVFDNGRTISLSKSHTSSGETTKHGSPIEILLSSSSSTNNGTDAVKDSWKGAEETEEKLLLLSSKFLL